MDKTIGVITGKFAPLHTGHIYAITEAATQVDTLYVVLSYDEKFVNNLPVCLQDKLTLKKRLLWLKKSFSDMDHIKIIYVDETNMKIYPDGVPEWCNSVKSTLKENGVNSIDKWFSSETEYTWWIEDNFNCPNVVLDSERSMFNISATNIRSNPYKYWQYLPSIIRKEFLLKVVLIGEESCAKSTLTKSLAKLYNTSWVEEYGRTYCENDMCGDESLLSFEDYGIIASERNYQERSSESTANQLLFVDTNAFVTQYYCKLYEGKLHPLVDAYIEQEDYDLIFHMSNEVPWVDDGLRINSDRELTEKLFDSLLDKYDIKGDNYHKITGNYNERLNKVISIINDLLKGYSE